MGARRRRLNQQAAAGLSAPDRRGSVDFFDSPPPPRATHHHPRPAGLARNPALPLILTVAGCLAVACLVFKAALHRG
jgi:hypothetical protein